MSMRDPNVPSQATVIGGPLSRPRPPHLPTSADVADELEKLMTQAKLTGDADLDEAIRECVRLLEVKGQDYTVGKNDVDRLYNFRVGAENAGITPQQVWWVYFWKHLTAIQRHVKQGKVDSEGIEGRVVDAINYLLLYFKICKEQKRGNI